MPSPDGSWIALAEFHALDQAERAISIKDWAADGKSLFVSSQTPTSTTLLRVDLQGRATPLWDQRGGFRTYAIAATNGRDLAIAGMTSDSNVWMIDRPCPLVQADQLPPTQHLSPGRVVSRHPAR